MVSLEGRKEGLSSARRRRRRRRRRRHEVPFREKERKRDPITSSIKITHNNHPSSSSSVERFTPKPPTPKALENRKTKKKDAVVKVKVTLYLADRARERVFHVVGFSSSSSSWLDNTKNVWVLSFLSSKVKKKIRRDTQKKGGTQFKKKREGKRKDFQKKK